MPKFKIDDSEVSDNNSPNNVLSSRLEDSDLDNQLQRSFKKEIHKIKILAIKFFAFICACYVLIYFWNLLGYKPLCWLASEELKDMRDHAIAIGTGVAAALANAIIFGNKR